MAKKAYIGATNFTPRDLPSGYTQVEYIESSGAQYIDTGFKPNQDTRVVADIQMVAENSLAANDIFGARTSASSQVFAVQWNTANNQFQHFYNDGYDNLDFGNFDIRQVVEMNKNVFTLNGVTHTRTYTSFQCNYSLYIFAVNNAGSAQFYSNARMYSCQIYDNGTVVRDYVPCLHDGTAGLYDMVNGVFYTNAETGSFTVGETLQVGISREVEKIYIGVAGVGRKVEKAYIGINGVARESFLSETTIGDLTVGSSVFMNVNGGKYEFLIVHQGLPSSIYDASCNGTWLLMKNLYSKKAWNGSNNDYANSTIHDYLNSTVIGVFDSNIQSTIKQVKIPYHKGTGPAGSVASGSKGLSTKIFLLSCYEVGWTTKIDSDFPVDGACLSYFIGTAERDSKRIGYYNNAADIWWLRSPRLDSDISINCVSVNGDPTWFFYDSSRRMRPAFILPLDTLVDENFNVIA